MYKRENIFTINSQKLDGVVRRSWTAELLNQTDDLLTFMGVFNEEIIHPNLGIIRPGTISYEFYWTNRWFNIFRFHEPDGELRNFYCNVNKPPVFSENTVNYVDLDIDVLVWKDLSFEILDLEEYEINARRFKYPPELKNKVDNALIEILKLIKSKCFPFDYVVL